MTTNKHAILTAVVIATIAAMGLASIFASNPKETIAQSDSDSNFQWDQMVEKDGLTMSGMQAGQMMSDGSMHSMDAMMSGMSTFSTFGMSMVEGVQITGASIASDHEISVNLRYTGNGSSPRVTIVSMAHADAMNMMNSMMSMSMVPHREVMAADDNNMMMNSAMMQSNAQNMAMHDGGDATSMMPMHMNMQSGSNMLNSGWDSPSTVKIKFASDGTSSYDMSQIMVMVFPLVE
ncbi:MAG: hypothetical protein ACREBU_23870 [Nitrososphaera sp.]